MTKRICEPAVGFVPPPKPKMGRRVLDDVHMLRHVSAHRVKHPGCSVADAVRWYVQKYDCCAEHYMDTLIRRVRRKLRTCAYTD